MHAAIRAFPFLALAFLVLACQTPPPPPELATAPEYSAVTAAAPGIAPLGDPEKRRIGFALRFGTREAIRSWDVDIYTGSVLVKNFSGDGSYLPENLSWDGRAPSGGIWPEGIYSATLTVDYGDAYFAAYATSEPFLLSLTPPSVKLAASPPSFTPAGLGMAEPLAVKISAAPGRKDAEVEAWTVEILDSSGGPVRKFEGAAAAEGFAWDGVLEGGSLAEPGSSFTAVASVRDKYGNVGSSSIIIQVKDQPPPSEASIIETEFKGFSPLGERNKGRIDFSVFIGEKDALKAWSIDIEGDTGIKRSFRGEAADAPASISWDGSDETGALAPEGRYRAALTVDFGRTYKKTSTRSREFILAYTPPTSQISAKPEAFSPAEKGVAGPVSVLIDASSPLAAIDTWSLDVLDQQGKLVKSFSGRWPANQAIWDGKTLSGAWVEPGSEYALKASVVDEFGNKRTATARLAVNDIPQATEQSLIEPRSKGFSPTAPGPTGSGAAAAMDFFLATGNKAAIKSWKVVVSHAERGAQRSLSGADASLTRSISWDGRTDSGELAPDGLYFATLSIEYGISFKPVSVKSASFALVATAPDAALALDPPRFTPKAGTVEKPVQLSLTANSRYADLASWSLAVLDQDQNTVAAFKGAWPPSPVSWDGRTISGQIVEPSATYTVVAEVLDSFGNAGQAKSYLPVDDLPPVSGETAITPSASGFSPNGDGASETIDLGLTVPNRDSVASWKVVIVHATQGPQRTFSGDRFALSATITWLGRGDVGGPAPEGMYTAELSVDYGTMFKPVKASSRKFSLVTTPPKGSLSISPALLVPDEKGLVSPAQIRLDASQGAAMMASWGLAVADQGGKTLRSYEGAWPPKAIAWDGTGADGSLALPGALYSVAATIKDEFGNTGLVRSSIRVSGLPAATEASSVRALSAGFSPRAVQGAAQGTPQGAMQFALEFGNRNLIKRWALDIERDDKTLRMSFGGDQSNLPPSFSWSGKLQDGTIAPDGVYLANLSIDYGRAYAPASVSSQGFTLVATPPTASIAMSPALFSPDGDGSNETLSLRIDASSRFAAINDWTIDVSDPGGNLFTTFRGKWPTDSIAWDGKSAKGEVVASGEDYPILVRVNDEFGNSIEIKDTIHVDILVAKMGDGFRVQVSSIVFKSFSADYRDVPPDRAERNLATLNLLSDKLSKFPGYQIKIVGHAVMVNWDDPVKGRAEQEEVLIPLSKSRAAAIKEALTVRGIDAARMTVTGVGASEQVVPDSDFANRWKNRRVEFFLQKK